MKTKNILKKITAIFFAIALSFSSIHAQWNYINAPDINTNSGVQTTGIGYYPASGAVRAILHINSFYMTPSTYSVSPGDVLRTDAINTSINEWTMYTGATYATSSLKGRIFVPALSNTFTIESAQGALQFNTDSTKRMTVTKKGSVVIYNSIVLKASDGDNYFRLTVNVKGEIKITPVDAQSL